MSKKTIADSPCAYVYSLRNTSTAPAELIQRHLPDVDAGRILIKPNWVKHQENEAFPIEAMVTDSELLDAAVMACLEKYPHARAITVGDVPLQSCHWQKLIAQTGLNRLITKYSRYSRPKIQFLDLRREKFTSVGGFAQQVDDGEPGDPLGYHEVRLDHTSFLEPISHQRNRFRVSDYDHRLTVSSHAPGVHRYLIARSVLEADLIVNMPKMKTHKKAGITGALKNLVGINGQKAYLVHYRRGTPRSDGDEFPPDASVAVRVQVRLREFLQKRSRLAFGISRPLWHLIRRTYGIQVHGTAENLGKRFYIAAGSWYGNDTIWRMVYDLNKIILYASREEGKLSPRPQRSYWAILDGVVAGEGNGPLQPLPVRLGILAFSGDPFVMDSLMARLMGFDFQKIPQLANMERFADTTWGQFDPQAIPIWLDGETYRGLSSVPILHFFLPPPGWKDHIEVDTKRRS